MGEIHVLDSVTVDKIAAGEVVERPSSIVKELVENSIDAGADMITVEIKDGGISMIRVTDNGSGIDKSQIEKAFMRHATSKISDASDLFTVTSLGFRGEALSSICAVCQVEMITKTKDDFIGVRVECNGGVIKDMQEVGAPDGTTIVVRNIFYNTPVRQKFLKSKMTEGGYINDLMQHLALSKPNVAFKFIQNGQTKFFTSGNGDVSEIIYRIFGKDIAKNVIKVKNEAEGFALEAYLGKPILNRSTRSFEIFFVNSRFIKSKLISAALEEGYKSYLMQHKFPFAILYLSVDTDKIDVNVHPTKMDIRIHNPQPFCETLKNWIEDAMAKRDLIWEIEDESKRETAQEIAAKEKKLTKLIPEPFESKRSQELFVKESPVYGVRNAGLEERTVQKEGTIANNSQTSSIQEEFFKETNSTTSKSEEFFVEREAKPPKSGQTFVKHENALQNESTSKKETLSETEKTLSNSREISQNTVSQQALSSNNESNLSKDSFTGLSTETTSSENSNTNSATQTTSVTTAKMQMQPTAEEMQSSNTAIQEAKSAIPAVKILGNVTETKRSEDSKIHSNILKQSEHIFIEKPEQMELSLDKFFDESVRGKYKILGQIFDTYWLLTYEDKLFIMDQHAAHEKVMYEKFMRQMKEQTLETQNLNPPIIVTLTGKEQDLYKEYEEQFEQMGFLLEEFGGNEFALRQVPVNLYGYDEKNLFLSTLDELLETPIRRDNQLILEKIASMSCKAAVKGNQSLSFREAEELVETLFTLENPYNCPHGRPTVISMSKYEIEKKFKRIV